MFDQERCFEGGEGREFVIPSMIFSTYMLETYSPHTDISHVGGHLACGLYFTFNFFSRYAWLVTETGGLCPRYEKKISFILEKKQRKNKFQL